MRFALIIAVLCSLAGVAHATPASETHKAYLTLIDRKSTRLNSSH